MSLMSSEVLHHLTWENYKVMPWKNGLGTTTQLAIFPHKEEFSLQTFLWRVSIASVETENSFSELIGYDRVILLIKGKGMALHITDEGGIQQERTIDTLYDDSFSFKGETKIMCSLIDGPLNDFNLMTRREYGTSEVVTVHLEGGNSVKKILSGTHDLIHCLEGPLIVQIQPSDKTVSMEVSDTLHLENRVESESVLIRAPSKRGVAFLITIKKHT